MMYYASREVYSNEEDGFFCERCGIKITEHEYSMYKGYCSECAKGMREMKAHRYVRKRNYGEDY